jgi:hypothetical protein
VAALNESDVYIWYRTTTSIDDRAVSWLTNIFLLKNSLAAIDSVSEPTVVISQSPTTFCDAHSAHRLAIRYQRQRQAVDREYRPSSAGIVIQPFSYSRMCRMRNHRERASWPRCRTNRSISTRIQEIADRYLSEEEKASLRQCLDELRNVRFTELWTLKEAFLKATGGGLSGPLTSISFRFDEHALLMPVGICLSAARLLRQLFLPYCLPIFRKC